MARSLFSDLLLDRKGNALSNITVTVYDEGTTTPISDTIFASRTGAATLTNPYVITAANKGDVTFWLDVDTERVDVKYSGAAITTKTVTLDGVSPDDLGGGGVSDHGALTGLADDDHPQYETSAEAQAKVDAHTTDASDAHDASAISFVPAGTIAATDVQAAIEEAASEAGGSTRELRSFTYIAQGTTTYTLPAGITAILVELVGGGGGGGGADTAASSAAAASGGAGAGYAKEWIENPAASYPVSVGAGGTGGVGGGADATAGGNTTFGSPPVCAATGGTGGLSGGVAGTSAFLTGSVDAGVGTVGDLLINGSGARVGIRLSGTVGASGAGGDSILGKGGREKSGAGAGNAPAAGYGGAGGGALVLNGSAAVNGAAGTNGRIIVWEFGPA